MKTKKILKELNEILENIDWIDCTFWACDWNRKRWAKTTHMKTCSVCYTSLQLKRLIHNIEKLNNL